MGGTVEARLSPFSSRRSSAGTLCVPIPRIEPRLPAVPVTRAGAWCWAPTSFMAFHGPGGRPVIRFHLDLGCGMGQIPETDTQRLDDLLAISAQPSRHILFEPHDDAVVFISPTEIVDNRVQVSAAGVLGGVKHRVKDRLVPRAAHRVADGPRRRPARSIARAPPADSRESRSSDAAGCSAAGDAPGRSSNVGPREPRLAPRTRSAIVCASSPVSSLSRRITNCQRTLSADARPSAAE